MESFIGCHHHLHRTSLVPYVLAACHVGYSQEKTFNKTMLLSKQKTETLFQRHYTRVHSAQSYRTTSIKQPKIGSHKTQHTNNLKALWQQINYKAVHLSRWPRKEKNTVIPFNFTLKKLFKLCSVQRDLK